MVAALESDDRLRVGRGVHRRRGLRRRRAGARPRGAAGDGGAHVAAARRLDHRRCTPRAAATGRPCGARRRGPAARTTHAAPGAGARHPRLAPRARRRVARGARAPRPDRGGAAAQGRAWAIASSSSGESCCSHCHDDDALGVGAGLAAAVDRGQHDPVAGVVEQRQRPRQVPAHVAEGVVPHHREVAQRVARLEPQRRDLLAQPVHVLGQVVARARGARSSPARPGTRAPRRPRRAAGRGRRAPRRRAYDRQAVVRRRRERARGKMRG